jgi:taurine dioxygenase
MSVAEARYDAPDGLSIAPLSPTIGAEVSGIDMAQPLSSEQQQTLYQALLTWKVVFFRDQEISREQHLEFSRNFGELEVHPFAPHADGYPEILALSHDAERPGQENTWHSDVTWRLEPSLGSILRCHSCPEVGGDTLFADMYAAYEGLPADIRRKIDGLVAVHDFQGFRSRLRKKGVSEERIEAFKREYPNPEHPVVRTHPDTGRNTIYVNAAFTSHIVGMEKDDSDRLLQYLYSQAATPEYQCRFRWRPNSVAFWDNRACQHYAASDYWPQERRMDRVTIIGDKPFYRADVPPVTNEHSPMQGRLARIRKGDLADGYR